MIVEQLPIILLVTAVHTKLHKKITLFNVTPFEEEKMFTVYCSHCHRFNYQQSHILPSIAISHFPRINSAKILTLLKSHYKSFPLKNVSASLFNQKWDFKFAATNTCIPFNPIDCLKETDSLHLLSKKTILTFSK